VARTCEIQHLASAGAPGTYYIRDRVKVIRSCSSRTHRRWRKRSQGENKIFVREQANDTITNMTPITGGRHHRRLKHTPR
jgi:hypothetical protein